MTRPDVSAVLKIVAAVARETGVPEEIICSGDKQKTAVRARRSAMKLARASGATVTVIAKAIGISGCGVRRSIGPGSQADERSLLVKAKDMLRPFLRPNGRTASLTVCDYSVRAKISIEDAAAAISRLQDAGFISREYLAKASQVAVFDLTEAGREACE